MFMSEMKEKLEEVFNELYSASQDCRPNELPEITKAMIEIYKLIYKIR